MITPDSLVPPSEPPDINNWFSSYENESLVLETNDIFGGFSDSRGDCTSGNSIPGTGTGTGTTSRVDVEELLTNHDISKQSAQQNHHLQDSSSPDSPLLTPVVESEPPGIENWFSSYAYESPVPDDMDKFILCPPADYKQNMLLVVANGKQQYWKDVEKPAETLSHLIPSHDMTCHQILKACETENACRKHSTNSPKIVNQMLPDHSPKNAIPLDDAANGAGDGFVSIKRQKYNNSMCGDQKRASLYVSKMKKTRNERKILGDVTNIDEHSGKWKCPQKRKPDIGPPLKQLRLGQWFHYA